MTVSKKYLVLNYDLVSKCQALEEWVEIIILLELL